MNLSKAANLLLNVLIPLLFGAALYFFPTPILIKNHLADGLWAFAFLSALIIVWNRKVPALWVTVAILVPILFEYLQYTEFIPGTGDLLDIAAYFTFYGIAIFVQQSLLNTKPLSNE